jgi:DNA-binding protein HU-beta
MRTFGDGLTREHGLTSAQSRNQSGRDNVGRLPDPQPFGGNVNKAELIGALESKLGSKKAASDALEAVLDVIIREVARGGKVGITGFGTFQKVARGARTGRNPRTGETVKIKKTTVPKFNAGTAFKKVVADPRQLPKAAAAGGRASAGAATKAASAAAGVTKTAAKRATSATKSAAKTTTKAAPARSTAKAAPARSTAKAVPAKAATKTATRAATRTAKATPAKKAASTTKAAATKTARATPAKKTTSTKAAPAKRASTAKAAPAKTTTRRAAKKA